ncbi:hypothetical protein PHMEG_0004716 [Phytophthora megakarya]|uniref:Reverse transcriptase n=1 Tax=Phytophthora megakarya TaxID=4795 RepID=A0A225WUT2_9STRA|nr:hypothetical protein PHMEG_0004716 [Phytophthora megakarya]
MEGLAADEVLTAIVGLLAEQQSMMKKLTERSEREKCVEGISMPHYAGNLEESLEIFLDQD